MGFQKGSIRRNTTPIEVQWLGEVDYQATWDRQVRLLGEIAAGDRPDTMLILEHPATYTAGKRTEDSDRPTNGLPVIDVDRGGRITWHGPGQLVAYPLIKLADPVDVVDYVRRLEQALIATCNSFGLDNAGRVEGRSGVWLPAGVVRGQLLPARKIAAIGIRVTKGVTMHGISLNCNNSFDYYDHIVPCGLSDAGVTSLSAELDQDISVDSVRDIFADFAIAALDGKLKVNS